MAKFILASTFVTILALPSIALADDAVKAEQTEEGYGYIFHDDPMTGNANAAGAARIKVRPRGVRRTLIRPRTNFVPEMLLSIEQL